ncbi:MAG: carboxypeptidase regulatory-like domain-containing protein, partial [Abitibacteriaceae bacterium]|nr:carboxypeptidase regulatory-like domain-containing protein [Abditibacteriaceae bacterium]
MDSAFAAHSTAARLMTVQNALGNVVSGGMTGLGASGALTAGVSSVVSAREGAGAADTIINGIMTSGVNTSSAPAELAGAKVVSLTEGVLKAMFMTKMQLSMLACFGLTLVGTGAGHLAQLALAAVKHRPPHLPQHHILPTVAEPSLSTRQHQSQADSFMFMVRGRGRVDGKWSIGRVPVATKETVPLNNSPFLQAHVQVHTDVQAQPAAGTKVASIEAAGIEPGVYSQAITQAASVSDGIYKLTSLGAGSASVTVYDPTGKKSVPTLQNIKEVAGQRAAAAQRASEPNPMPRTASLEGQVRDETGQPVAGAKIMSPDGDPRLQVTSDAAGKFVLTSLPPGSVMVVAGLTNRIGEARDVIGQQPLIVTLAPVKPLASNDIQRAYELLDDLWASTEGTPYYRTNIPATLAAYNPDLAVQLAARQDGTLDENVLGEIILNLALADPTRAAAWVPAQLPRFKNSDMLFGIRSLLAYALAGVQPDLARDFYTQAKAYAQEQTARDAKNAQALARRGITLSHAAHNLGLYDEANQWTQAAITAVKASNGQERQGMLASLACLDYDETVQMMDALPADQRKLQIHMAISAVAATDPKLARRWLDKLIAVEKATPRGGGYSGEATRTLVQAVGHTDPTGALDLARSVSNSYNKFICLAIAAQFQPRTTALQVLHEASDLGRQHHLAAGDVIARVAALTYDLDPKLGTDLFAQAKEQWEAQRTQQEGQETYDNGTAAFAYYYSRIDPAASRLLLEGEFAYQMQRPKTANHGLWQHGWQLRGLVEAMAAIDVDRALELSY